LQFLVAKKSANTISSLRKESKFLATEHAKL